jgi:cytochrome c5
MADGSEVLSVTCSTCHARREGESIVDGLPNANLDVGAAMLDEASGAIDPALGRAVAAWGPGRIDVSSTTGKEPARIPDLRPVAWLGYLQQDATVRMGDLTSLAIRIETLIITAQDEVVRPPRIVTLALAAYVRSLARELPSTAKDTDSAIGARVFGQQCAGCHRAPSLTGPPIPLELIGTDPTLGLSPERGTGAYRVPSLHGVGSRGPLLHDGTVPTVAALFDPARPTDAYTQKLHGEGAVPGHLYGLELSDSNRAALVAYVQSL